MTSIKLVEVEVNEVLLETVHKTRPQSRGRGFDQSGHFSDKGAGGSSDADVRTFWRKKTSDFSTFTACPHGQAGRSGLASADILRAREEGSIFRDFVRTSFMGGLLL